MHGRHAMCNPTIMCRTALLREVGGYQADGVLEDWGMFLRMGERRRTGEPRPRAALLPRSWREHERQAHGRIPIPGVAFALRPGSPPAIGLGSHRLRGVLGHHRSGSIRQRVGLIMEGYAQAQYRLALADLLWGVSPSEATRGLPGPPRAGLL